MPDIDLSLYLVTDRSMMKRKMAEVVSQAVEGGVTAVQLREKDVTFREFMHLAVELKSVLEPMKVPLLINDRVDVALAAGADGVHLGMNDMPPDLARKFLGPDCIIGLSVEKDEDIEYANRHDIDYAGVSPVFNTTTKTDTINEWGLDGIQRVAEGCKHKIVGIGSLNKTNAGEVIRHGADGVAVVSAICAAEDPGNEARQLRRIIDEAKIMCADRGEV